MNPSCLFQVIWPHSCFYPPLQTNLSDIALRDMNARPRCRTDLGALHIIMITSFLSSCLALGMLIPVVASWLFLAIKPNL